MKRKLLVTSILASTASGFASAALEEVIVTAQKRAESVNDVGLSISAATNDRLESLGVVDTADLVKIAPGLVFTVSQNGTPLYSLRGIGFNDYTLGASPAVSVYVDEVPLPYSAFTKGTTIDLERVEVLKGPQGLLFGQNSTGGAINYVAAKPTAMFQAGIRGSYGSYNRFEGEGFVSGELADQLAGRIAIGTIQSKDWQDNAFAGQTNGGDNLVRGRLQLLWSPNDDTEILAGISGWSDKSDPQAGQLVGLKLQVTDPTLALLADVPETQRRINAFQALPLSADDAEAAGWGPNGLNRNDSFFQFSVRVDYAINDSLSVASITAYSEYNEDYSMDRDGSNLQNAGIQVDGGVYSFSQELRLSGDFDDTRWVVGLNYAYNHTNSDERISTADSTNTAILPGGPWIDSTVSSLEQEITDKAIFANVEHDLSDSWTILLGARYSDNENKSSSCMHEGDAGMRATFPFIGDVIGGRLPGTTSFAPGTDPCISLNPANAFLPSYVPFEQKLSEDNVSWRAGLNFAATADLLIYGLVSEG
jgi:outer membrane receptor protein involved in Fe transport